MQTIGGKTRLYGIIGDPIEHTLSPLMQNRAFEVMGIDAVYVPFHVSPPNLERAVKAIAALHIFGLNVTVPHKTPVIGHLDRVSEAAKAVGAVNTVINRDGVLFGENTDVYGFEQCILRDGGLEKFPSRICILGAGGAARGVAYACAGRKEVEEIIILNRTISRAREIGQLVSELTGKRITAAPADTETQRKYLPEAGMIVNTTSIGMHPATEESPAPDPEVFRSGQVVCDIVYTPIQTLFLRDAEMRGAKTVGGLSMLVYQGARAFTLWTGMEAPVAAMQEALRNRIESV